VTALTLFAAASACGTDLLMHDPKTGDSFECGSRGEVSAWDLAANSQREEACVRDSRLRGRVRSLS
jgi:hypothetical protein